MTTIFVAAVTIAFSKVSYELVPQTLSLIFIRKVCLTVFAFERSFVLTFIPCSGSPCKGNCEIRFVWKMKDSPLIEANTAFEGMINL